MNVTRRDEGQVLQVVGDRVTVKLPSGRSPHGMSIVDVVLPPGSGTPCVTHDKEEEVYFLLEGELLMHTPTASHRLHPGDLVHLPPLTPYGYRNPGEQPARFLAWTVGGPPDQFFERMRRTGNNCRTTFRACVPQWMPSACAASPDHPTDPRKDVP